MNDLVSTLPTVHDMPALQGKKVFLRADLNVPIAESKVTDDYRIQKVVPTLEYLTSRGAKVILTSHLGRDPKETLRPVYENILARMPIAFSPQLLGESTDRMLAELGDGEVLLLENLRSNEGEEKNDEAFAKKLAALADYYVNDAFSASHRSHASIVGVPALLPAFAGLQLADEVRHLTHALAPKSPSLCILGGAKFETKEALIDAVLTRYDRLFLGGALANDALRARGYHVGVSLVSKETDTLKCVLMNPKVMVPLDVTVQSPDGVHDKKPSEVTDDDNILDCGPETTTELGMHIANAATVLWNGPLGNFEHGFAVQTESVAQLIAQNDCVSYIGGGDTVSAISRLGLMEQFTFVSTGGGAMLDFLVDGKLPGIDALLASGR